MGDNGIASQKVEKKLLIPSTHSYKWNYIFPICIRE